MIICPSCNLENSGQNRLCQQCGQPLQLWRALVIASSSQPPAMIGGQPMSPASLRTDLTKTSSQSPLYLDSQQRYQLQPPRPPQAQAAVVIDCYPAQASPIASLQADWLENPDQETSHLTDGIEVPREALPYLALQADFFPIVPELHHAWTASDYSVLLIEDRSQWSLLQDSWKQETAPLQQVAWLYEMTLLWEALSPWQCQQTLLIPQRLRVDPDDQLLCLEHLTCPPGAPPPPLADLGSTWQQLIQLHTSPPPLRDLVNALATGQIEDTATLKQQLSQLADRYQSPPPAATTDSASAAMPAPSCVSSTLTNNGHPPIQTASPLPETPAMSAFSSQQSDEFDLPISSTGSSPRQAADDDSDSPEVPTMVLPMKLVQVTETGRTYVGRQREHNEDYYQAQTHLNKQNSPQGEGLQAKGLYILCDGMGGHASGEVASEMAVQTLMDYFTEHWQSELPSRDVIHQGVMAANQAIYDINQANDRLGSRRMGTTLVMVLLSDTQAVVAHVGDSRLYTYNRHLGLTQVTADHEVGQREIQRGVEPAIAYARPDAHQLTQALGPRSYKDVKPDITYIDIVEDTLFLLCSDGLSDNDLIEKNYETHLEPLLRSRADLDAGLTRLITLANDENGHDNITAILVRVKLKPDMDRPPI